jgi:hypothetical protein
MIGRRMGNGSGGGAGIMLNRYHRHHRVDEEGKLLSLVM